MSDQIEMTDPIDLSIGGIKGHLLRRGFHISMTGLPVAYYGYGEVISGWVDLGRDELTSILILMIILIEGLRLRSGITIFGQREYEAKQVSALAWGALAVGLTCLAAPKGGWLEGALGIPIIMSLTLGDPAMGEARRLGASPSTAFLVGTSVCATVWLVGALWMGTPWWLVPIMAPLTTAAEWPRLKWIDDNATMCLIPLAAVIIAAPFISF